MDSYKYKYLKYKRKYLDLKGGNNSKMLLLTAPHSYCNNELIDPTNHHCDLAVTNILNLFTQLLNNTTIKYSTIQNNNVLRQLCDLNREFCDEEKIKKSDSYEFIKEIKNKLNDTYLLIDIHSFPTNRNNEDFYIIYNERDKDLATQLITYLKSKDDMAEYNINMYLGKTNYIIETANQNNVNGLLFEFKEYDKQIETYQVFEEKRKKLIKYIIEWIKLIIHVHHDK
jgi:hypothetical protein